MEAGFTDSQAAATIGVIDARHEDLVTKTYPDTTLYAAFKDMELALKGDGVAG